MDPTDQYELEEEIMTALYGYKDPETGKRVVALALSVCTYTSLNNC